MTFRYPSTNSHLVGLELSLGSPFPTGPSVPSDASGPGPHFELYYFKDSSLLAIVR